MLHREVVMKQVISFFQHRIIYGSAIAVLLSWIACFLFFIIDELRLLIEFPKYFHLEFFLEFFMVEMSYGIMFLLFPTMFGGAILAYLIDQDAKKQKLSLNRSFLKGGFIGAIAGFGVALLVWAYVISLHRGEPDFDLFLSRTIIAGLLAFAAGGLTGRQLYYFHKKRQEK
jgi:hypothetical protein